MVWPKGFETMPNFLESEVDQMKHEINVRSRTCRPHRLHAIEPVRPRAENMNIRGRKGHADPSEESIVLGLGDPFRQPSLSSTALFLHPPLPGWGSLLGSEAWALLLEQPLHVASA